jgi:hypothetical protein
MTNNRGITVEDALVELGEPKKMLDEREKDKPSFDGQIKKETDLSDYEKCTTSDSETLTPPI